MNPFFIAEISANHCGDKKIAKKLIKCANCDHRNKPNKEKNIVKEIDCTGLLDVHLYKGNAQHR